jgi:hypothetical protein
MLRRSIQTLKEMLPYIPSLQTSVDTLTQLSSDSKEELVTAMSNLHIKQMFAPDIKKKFRENFTKAVKGYHLLNDTPIKEARWEDVNATILEASGFPVVSQNGSHVSGADLTCSFGSLSNKSMKYNNGFDMSSYRLTSVTSAGSYGTAEEIIAEIQKRKNFQYYSMIIRKELETTDYDWYLIPADHPLLDPASYQWLPMMGKTGKNKDKVIGWETNSLQGSYMTITFSMSSQLWVHVDSMVDLEEYKMGSASSVPRKYNYIQLFERDL